MILGRSDTRTDAERKADADRAYDRGMVASAKLETLTVGEIKKGKAAMSLVGKLNALKERSQDFNQKTGDALDRIMSKMDEADRKRDDAEHKHNLHLDAITKAIDETTDVIEQLSNVPLGGETSTGG